MKEIKDVFVLLSTSAAKRKTQRQKGRFINYLTAEFTKNMIGCRIERKAEGGKNFISKLMGRVITTNLIVGDIKKAKKVFVAGYDTPTRALFGIKYFPFHLEKTKQQEGVNLLIKVAVSFLVLGLCLAGVLLSWPFSWTVRIVVILLAAGVNYLAYEGLMHWGNWYNFNKNNGGVAVLYQMIDTMGTLDDTVAYVFLDEVASSYIGYRHLQALLEEKNRNAEVLFLDCISWGKQLYLAAPAKMKPRQAAVKECLGGGLDVEALSLDASELAQTPLSLFSKGMMLVCGEMLDGDVVIYNTRTGKDGECDLQQLEDIVESLCRYSRAPEKKPAKAGAKGKAAGEQEADD